MKFFKPILQILIAVALSQAVHAQDTVPASGRTDDPGFTLPSLEACIDSALAHNPLVRFRELGITGKECNLNNYRTWWTRNVGLQADVRYGTFNNFSTNTAEGQSPSTFSTATSQTVWGVGAYVKFPFQDIINRRSQVRMAQSELDQAVSMAEEQREQVRQLMIRQYNDVLLKQRILAIRSKNLGNARINMDMLEKEFQNGTTPIVEYARISDVVTRVEADYESARTDFITGYMILEEMAGFRFSKETKK